MDVLGMHMLMSQAGASAQASVSVTKKAMDTAEVQMQGIIQMMQSITPSFGRLMDIRA